MKVDAMAACHIVGLGELFVRLSDGYLDYGKTQFDISYVRPDPKD